MAKELEQEFEAVRKKMEETAVRLGLDHPEVHRLSRRLDRLHNQLLWENTVMVTEVPGRRRDRFYRIRRYTFYLKEATGGCG